MKKVQSFGDFINLSEAIRVGLSTKPDDYGAYINQSGEGDPKSKKIPISHIRSTFEPKEKTSKETASTGSRKNVEGMVKSLRHGKSLPPITVRRHGIGYQVIDGHHRLQAHKEARSKHIDVQEVPPIFVKKLTEDKGLSRKDFHEPLKDFVSYCSDQLGIETVPELEYKEHTAGEQPSFAAYAPGSNKVYVYTKHRHPMDIFRSVAHELVHHKQNEDGRITNASQEGSTGSDIENEANAVAGQLMRLWGKANPSCFDLSYVTEGHITRNSLQNLRWRHTGSADRSVKTSYNIPSLSHTAQARKEMRSLERKMDLDSMKKRKKKQRQNPSSAVGIRYPSWAMNKHTPSGYPKASPRSKTPATLLVDTGWRSLNVQKNPSPDKFATLMRRNDDGVRILWNRGIWYVWPAMQSNHSNVYTSLGLSDDDMEHIINAQERRPNSMYGCYITWSPHYSGYGDMNGGKIYITSDFFEPEELQWMRDRMKKDRAFIQMTKKFHVVGVHDHGKPEGAHRTHITPEELRKRVRKNMALNLSESNMPSWVHKNPTPDVFARMIKSYEGIRVMKWHNDWLFWNGSWGNNFHSHGETIEYLVGSNRKEHDVGDDQWRIRRGVLGFTIEAEDLKNKILRWDSDAEGLASKKYYNFLSRDHKFLTTLGDYTLTFPEIKKSIKGIPKNNSKQRYETLRKKVKRDMALNLSEMRHEDGLGKAVILAGGSGSGKNFVMSKTLEGLPLKEINSDAAFVMLLKKNKVTLKLAPGPMRDRLRQRAKEITKKRFSVIKDNRIGVIINRTMSEYEDALHAKKELEDAGYETFMVYVGTSNKVGRLRNIERGKKGDREVPEIERFKTWMGANKNKARYQELFGPNFAYVDNSDDYNSLSPEKKRMKDALFNMIHKKVRAFVYKKPIGINEKFEDMLCELGGAGNWGTDKLRARYMLDTPGQEEPILGLDNRRADWMENPKILSHFMDKYGKYAYDKGKKIKESLEGTMYDSGMGVSDSSAKDDVKPDPNADFEKTSLFKKSKKPKYNRK